MSLALYCAGREKNKCFQIPGLDFESEKDKVSWNRMQRALSVSCGYSSPQRGFQVLTEFTNDHKVWSFFCFAHGSTDFL